MKRNKIWIIIIGQEFLCGLLPFFVNFTLEYAVKKVEENWHGLKLHGTHQLLIHACDVTVLDENTNSI
jgi:hypothetical protein